MREPDPPDHTVSFLRRRSQLLAEPARDTDAHSAVWQRLAGVVGPRRSWRLPSAHWPAALARPDQLWLQVGRGNELLLNVLDLADRLPPELQPGSKRAAEVAAVAFRFSYFQSAQAAERKLESTPGLSALEQAFQQVRHTVPCAGRFVRNSGGVPTSIGRLQGLDSFPQELYALLGAVVLLHRDFLRLLSQLQEGTIVQCSLQSLLLVRGPGPHWHGLRQEMHTRGAGDLPGPVCPAGASMQHRTLRLRAGCWVAAAAQWRPAESSLCHSRAACRRPACSATSLGRQVSQGPAPTQPCLKSSRTRLHGRTSVADPWSRHAAGSVSTGLPRQAPHLQLFCAVCRPARGSSWWWRQSLSSGLCC